jgi:hypothetical protein
MTTEVRGVMTQLVGRRGDNPVWCNGVPQRSFVLQDRDGRFCAMPYGEDQLSRIGSCISLDQTGIAFNIELHAN